jgi:hypothetical protein
VKGRDFPGLPLTNILTRILGYIWIDKTLLWSCGRWIYNYLCNQCLSPLMLWIRISIRVRCTTLCDKVCQWLATGRWLSPGLPISSTKKTDRHNTTEILLKVALSTIKQTTTFISYHRFCNEIVLRFI